MIGGLLSIFALYVIFHIYYLFSKETSASNYQLSYVSPIYRRYNNARQYLNIDLGTVSRLKRIATQGRYDADQWVTSYAVSYSMNNVRFIPYKEGRRVKVMSFSLSVSLI